MNEFDEQIRDALQAEHDDLAYEDELDYEGIVGMFRGHSRWVSITCASLMAVTITVMVVSAVQFFRVESVRAMIGWASGFTVCFLLEALFEFWFLAECRKKSLHRQIKRLELQVAAMASGWRNEDQ